ncbi:hypothetical protein A3K64_01365 [Candidatus Micrarchaeota archaeon RBG_16_36_9]|nr:MAG: hypothetical protein A3K64_01365 [Candidatus Micrarchaeota archaeon RBG_16_36_9]
MSLLKPGNKVCIIDINNVVKTVTFGKNSKPVNRNFNTAKRTDGEIEEIKDGICTIILGNYDAKKGFTRGNEKVEYPVEYLHTLERYRCIKQLV